MRPDDQTNNYDPAQPPIPGSQPDNAKPRQAAAQVIRSQIDSIYKQDPTHSGPAIEPELQNTPAAQPEPTPARQHSDIDVNPYKRTHAPNPQPEADKWRQYHSAWQNYYQKYYEGYYTHHLSQAQKQLQARYEAAKINQPKLDEGPAANIPTAPVGSAILSDEDREDVSKNGALFELRRKLREQVRSSAQKVRHSRHFIPIISAVAVVLVFLFLQYNSVLIANVKAYISPGAIDAQNIIVDPTTEISVGPEPLLIIPKINVTVPVIYNIGNDQTSQLAAMEQGVAHFSIPGASSVPGQVGNTVVAGHSSNDVFGGGDYKFIFSQLPRLTTGDTIYMNYQSRRYTYIVTGTEEVQPSEINKLVYQTDKPVLTLITCVPLGTARKRLLVTAEQISPDPAASTVPESSNNQTEDMPGNSPTLLERLFGA